ncbi:hypothetical protein BN7_3291 [Wickerhamomyces ciferrii]|uniref:Uncharacterized protein n=1 Tax=Wickerhamomyces ciferrii (strain ATCC 14091 / BCRC 22168 / CBS 111 / JCM 3599 / NBRC 0793 / NRRL Y-1031 F-60-10) TaxID=1206466 RepID=K0KNI6_WICCF|nr:uncharacterized protein BN7_3291 [Wickerhamomyces ciferrii]CCH43737.1 hypothetical protein BN7_3291 [Wickerhamomyces ciferrii]
MGSKKKEISRKKKSRSRRSNQTTSHWKSFFTAALKILLFPIYVTYIFWRTLLIDKPREAAYAVKETFTTLYEKSKNGYRKAKKIKHRGRLQDQVLLLDDLSESDEEDEVIRNRCKKNGIIKRKTAFVRRTVFTVGHFTKEGFRWIWRLFIKTLHVKRTTQKNLKWSIRTSYGLWSETGKLVEKIKNFPGDLVITVKNFVREAIEGDNEDQSPEQDEDPNNFTLEDQSDLPEPISLRTSQELTSPQHWPDSHGFPTKAPYSRRPISRGRPQTRQSFSQRIEGTIPARKFFAPPTNEELIDDYFNTYDAIQPQDPYRRLVYSRTRRHQLISETDAESMDVNPRSAKNQEYDEDEDDQQDAGAYDEIYEPKHNDDDY